MLNESAQLAARFNAAFPRNGTRQDIEIAKACEVTKQAIPGWRSTGRIAKKHLPALAELSGRPLDWWVAGDPQAGEESFEVRETEGSPYLKDDQATKAVVALMRSTDAIGRGIIWQAAKQALRDYVPDKNGNFERRAGTG